MDEAIALIILAPVLVLGLWLMDFTGGAALADGRAQLAAYEGAEAAAEDLRRTGAALENIGNATDNARNAAIVVMLDACRDLNRNRVAVTFIDAGGKEWNGKAWSQAPAGTVLDAVRVNVRCRIGASPLFGQWRTGQSTVKINQVDSPARAPASTRTLGTVGQ